MEQLRKIQAELKAPKNQTNAFGKYKYRSCEDILEAVKPLLKEHNCTLTISDEVKEVCGLIYVEASAILTDGKNEVTVTAQAGIDPNRKGMDIAQSFGSSSSYARKYALNGLFLIDDTKEVEAQKPKAEKPELKPNTPEWEKALTAIKGGITIAQIEKKYYINPTNIKELSL